MRSCGAETGANTGLDRNSDAVLPRPHGDPAAIPLHFNRSPDGRPPGDGILRAMGRLRGRPWGPRKRTAPP
jgi:hypothetical protein